MTNNNESRPGRRVTLPDWDVDCTDHLPTANRAEMASGGIYFPKTHFQPIWDIDASDRTVETPASLFALSVLPRVEGVSPDELTSFISFLDAVERALGGAGLSRIGSKTLVPTEPRGAESRLQHLVDSYRFFDYVNGSLQFEQQALPLLADKHGVTGDILIEPGKNGNARHDRFHVELTLVS